MFHHLISYKLTAITGGTVGRELKIETPTEDPDEPRDTRRIITTTPPMSNHLNRNRTPSPLHAAATIVASSVTGLTPTTRAYVADDPDDIAYSLMYRSIRDSRGTITPLIDEVRQCLLRCHLNTPCPSNDAVQACLSSLHPSLCDTRTARRNLANEAEDAHANKLRDDVSAATTASASAVDRHLPNIVQGIWRGVLNRDDAYWACYQQGILPYDAWNSIERALTQRR